MKCLLAIAFFVASILVAVPVDACDCARLPACHALWAADSVFVGRVERVERAESRPYEAHLLVERWFRGEKLGTRVVIDVTGAGISCDAYAFFNEGHRYLVHAVRSATGEWRATLCGGTQPLESADEDLRYARAALRSRSPGSVSGFAFVDVRPEAWAQSGPPLVGAQLTLESAIQRYTATTDTNGDYRFDRVAAGNYTLRVNPFPGVSAIPPKRLVVGPNACIRHVFWTPPN